MPTSSTLRLAAFLLAPQLLVALAYGNDIVTIPAEGGKPVVLPIEPRMHFGSPCWSPDGKWLAFDGHSGGRKVFVARLQDDDLKSFNIDGYAIDLSEFLPDEPMHAVEVGGDAGMPSWSPDGKQLAWHTYSPGSVVVANFSARQEPEGSDWVVSVSPPVRAVGHWGNPVWFHKSDRLATIRGGGFSVYESQTRREKTLHNGPQRPRWGYSLSPDDNWIAYCTHDSVLMIAGIGDNPQPAKRRLTSHAGYSSWSPDGKRLVVSWRPEGQEKHKLYVLEADSAQPPKEIEGQDPDASYRQPSWSPDGKTIVCVRF